MELERARRDAERARAPAAGGQLQRRITELESQLAAADAQVQQLTVRPGKCHGAVQGVASA